MLYSSELGRQRKRKGRGSAKKAKVVNALQTWGPSKDYSHVFVHNRIMRRCTSATMEPGKRFREYHGYEWKAQDSRNYKVSNQIDGFGVSQQGFTVSSVLDMKLRIVFMGSMACAYN